MTIGVAEGLDAALLLAQAPEIQKSSAKKAAHVNPLGDERKMG